MKIIINEKQEERLINTALNEAYLGLGDKVGEVVKYLDKNFARAQMTEMGEDGRPFCKGVVAWLNDYKQVVTTLTDVQLFYVIQDQFKNIMSDKQERDEFLKHVIKDWYYHKISKYNSLSV